MEGITKKLSGLDKIPNSGKWTGYVWYSDSKYPEILDDQLFINKSSNTTFIIEALLFDGNKISIHIVHTHALQITEFNLVETQKYEIEKIEHIASNRLHNKTKKLIFYKVWAPIKKFNCLGYEVKELQAIVFRGFNSEKH